MNQEIEIKFRNMLSNSKLLKIDQEKFLEILERSSQDQQLRILMVLKTSPQKISLIWQAAQKRAKILKDPSPKEEEIKELLGQEMALLMED